MVDAFKISNLESQSQDSAFITQVKFIETQKYEINSLLHPEDRQSSSNVTAKHWTLQSNTIYLRVKGKISRQVLVFNNKSEVKLRCVLTSMLLYHKLFIDYVAISMLNYELPISSLSLFSFIYMKTAWIDIT